VFAIQCINRSYNYNRYVGLKSSGKPQIVYESSNGFPNVIKGFKEKKSAEDFLVKILTREGVDYKTINPHDIVDYALISDSTEFKIIKYKIQDDKLEILDSYQFTPESC
jgi:hypothetical protein